MGAAHSGWGTPLDQRVRHRGGRRLAVCTRSEVRTPMAPGPGGAVNRNWWPGWRKDLCLFHPGCPHGPDSNGLLPSTTGVRAGLGNPYAEAAAKADGPPPPPAPTV